MEKKVDKNGDIRWTRLIFISKQRDRVLFVSSYSSWIFFLFFLEYFDLSIISSFYSFLVNKYISLFWIIIIINQLAFSIKYETKKLSLRY